MLVAIIVATAAYLACIAVVVVREIASDSSIKSVIFFEVLFASPVLGALVLAAALRSYGARATLLFFDALYAIFSILMFYSILTSVHDAQWQLAFFLIPPKGFVGLAVAALAAIGFQQLGTHRK